eukprot:jgi/Tetstr1/423077/TSEL_013848.t1
MHDNVLLAKDSWSGRVKMTQQLRRDLDWWAVVPTHNNNGRSTNKLVETVYMHVYNSGYGWGAVLNKITERGARLLLWFILDTKDISVRARYIKTTANIWVDRLSHENDYLDWAFNLRHFSHLEIEIEIDYKC